MTRQLPGSRFLTDDFGNIVGAQDHDGDEHVLVFEGESTNSIAFDTTPNTARTLGVGELRWNETDGTLELALKGGKVVLQVGQEQVVRLRNTTANDIADGVAVYLTGSNGTFLTMELAQANTDETSELVIGVTTEPIAKQAEGFVTTFGLVRSIDTSGLTEGAPVWLSPTVAGGVTSTRPSAPDHMVLIGYCLRTHPLLGVLFVKAQDGYELHELHDVKITNPQDGQVLKYQASTGLWVNSAP